MSEKATIPQTPQQKKRVLKVPDAPRKKSNLRDKTEIKMRPRNLFPE